MKIRDIDLLKQVELLFQNEIMIWGAGEEGKDIARLLIEATIPITCFIDKNPSMWGNCCMGSIIMSPNEINERVLNHNTLVIIGSMQYAESILEDMNRMETKPSGGVFSWYGVQCAIELNIYNKVFNAEFRLSLLNKKRLMEESYDIKIKMGWYMEMWVDNQCNDISPVLFLTPTKVGHSTVAYSLRKRGIPIWCRHTLEEVPDIALEGFWKYSQQTRKIISLVREPIERDISAYMQRFYPSWVYCKGETQFDLNQNVVEFLKNNAGTRYGYLFDYFDVFYDITGVDIYRYPFDRERGYGIIRENNWEILILTLENLNRNELIIADFLAIPDFHLYAKNLGLEKCYKYLYQNLKEDIKIPKEVIEKYYIGNERMDYFYTEEQKQTMKEKYQIA